MEHTSTVLEPFIPFHTLVKRVDAEDIANDKIRTHDLALEVNNISTQLQTQTPDSSQQEQLLFTQSRGPNNKSIPAYKKVCFYCRRTNHSISACFEKKNNQMTKTKEMHMLDQNILKSHLYNTFVLPQTSEQNDMIQVIEVEVSHEKSITVISHKTDIARHLEIDSVTTRVLLLHNALDHDMTITKEIRDPIALLTDLLTDPFIDMTLVTDIDRARIQEITTILQDTHLLLDHLHDH